MNVHTYKLFQEGFANPATANTEFAADQLSQLRTYE